MDDDTYRDEAGAGDDPAAAFDRLRGEVSLLRSAMEGLTAARESIDMPDYEPTLERTEKILAALTQRIDPIAKSPLLSMTPGSMANEIVTAASGARREDARLVAEARSEEHTSELQSLMRISYAVFCLKKTKTNVETCRTN